MTPLKAFRPFRAVVYDAAVLPDGVWDGMMWVRRHGEDQGMLVQVSVLTGRSAVVVYDRAGEPGGFSRLAEHLVERVLRCQVDLAAMKELREAGCDR